MKKSVILAILPLFLFSLETVNLIKDHSFEKNSGDWDYYARTRMGQDLDPSTVSVHDQEKASDGFFSGFSDTRERPTGVDADSIVIIQGFCCEKIVRDIDSLYIDYLVKGKNDQYDSLYISNISLCIDAGQPSLKYTGYALKRPDSYPSSLPPVYLLEKIDFPDDSNWYTLAKDIRDDLAQLGVSENSSVDSFMLISWGGLAPSTWYGQKIYFDDVRLMGYADCDVGVKEILSGQNIGFDPYVPVARIKNFGRENAEFTVIAEISEGEFPLYVDTLPWSLPGDTEDTVQFAGFVEKGYFNLTIRTEMSAPPAIDESDANNEISMIIDYGGISEPVKTPSDISINISSTLSSPLDVSYSLPANQTGTISIYDQSGRCVIREPVTGSGKIDFNTQFSAGVYIVRMESDRGVISRKVIMLD